jgi:indole-3-glycerol phosphate synthase
MGGEESLTSILDDIVAAKRDYLVRQRNGLPQAALEQRLGAAPTPLNFSGALMADEMRLIAEVKKASPSRGLLRADFDPVATARAYAQNGAAAVSVLTDVHFQGSLDHLMAVKDALRPTGVPVLRKDFIFDPYQVYESRVAGADAILLIVAILDLRRLRELLALAASLWLQCLVEVHNTAELRTALEAGAEVIGVNNRDLHTFRTDLTVTEALAPQVPRGRIVVSESGISGRQDLLRLRRAGVHAVLVGEALMTAPDIGAKLRELLGRPAQQVNTDGAPP